MHNPLGGLSRKARVLQASRESGVTQFQVDTGDMHLKSSVMTPHEEKQYRIKTKLFRRVHEKLGLDVQGVGELDLAMGWPFIQEAYQGSSIQWVCANLRMVADGSHPFPAWKILERDGIRVGFIGLIGKDIGLEGSLAKVLEIEDPVPALTKAIAEVRAAKPPVDLVVLVSHLGQAEELRVAREVKGLDVVLGGHSRDYTPQPLLSQGVPIVQAGYRGKQLGRLDLWIRPDGPGIQPGAAEWSETTSAGAPVHRLGYQNRIEDLKKAMEFDPEVEAWVEAYKGEIAALPVDTAAPEVPAKPPADPFWGPEVCSNCHIPQAEFWKKTGHAKAMDTLRAVNQDKNADCIACHTLGYKDAAGFSDPAAIPKHLMDVTCEHCHGRGSLHGRKGVFNNAPRAEATCIGCHNPERDPHWDPKKIDMVACPKLTVAPVGGIKPATLMQPTTPVKDR